MADPFGIVSGSAGIISLGFTIAQGLLQIADAIGSAGREVRIYAEEINAFSKLLKYVRTELQSSTDIALDLQSLVNDVMDVCDRVLHPLNVLQSTLKPLLTKFQVSPRKFRQLALRLQWTFTYKEKLTFYREVLRSQRGILDTTLEVILLQATRDRSRPSILIAQLSLESSMTVVELSHRSNRRSGLAFPSDVISTSSTIAGNNLGPANFDTELDDGSSAVDLVKSDFVEELSGSDVHEIDEHIDKSTHIQDLGASQEPTSAMGVGNVEGGSPTWKAILNELQRMEHGRVEWKNSVNSSGDVDSCHITRVAVQIRRRKWDPMPSIGKKPYAMTAISDLVQITGMLGMHWKVFDRSENKYWAEGNGYTLTGTTVPELGVMFTLQIIGRPEFRGNRIIPLDTVKPLYFGIVPTIYMGRHTRMEEPESMRREVRNLGAVRLGSRQEAAETLELIGCSRNICSLVTNEAKTIAHLFPIPFEILGMLGKTIHEKDSTFRMLPNPVYCRWKDTSFTIRALLLEYCSIYLESFDPKDPISGDVELINASLSYVKLWDDITERHLCALNRALDKCDRELGNRESVLIVMRRHFQLVLSMMNFVDPDGSTIITGVGNAFKELDQVAADERPKLLMGMYFKKVLPKVYPSGSDDVKIWRTLIFRMLCWLLLHDFHENDMQIPKTELFNSEQPVYIA
ncbi:Complex 1 LYR protein [Purpureocillium lavendulum]|uniref:Complex 1 LYR protein n=1 Tax=Purpureocillium lavendulum TaxID=1247861 RepID=A0AB34FL62_9HYPO|nr:Complex 1 LYR protein [Purpureocillium lavendulum]